jgi:hypothetical protein
MLLTLPLDTMLVVAQREAKNTTPPGHTPQDGSLWPLANTQTDKAPKGGIDITVIRNIDLMFNARR